MSIFPTIKIISSEKDLEYFQTNYNDSSELDVPMDYLKTNKVFAFCFQGIQIGGFVLGTESDFRTIKSFAGEEAWPKVKRQIENPQFYTELCCFWINPEYRCKMNVNLILWFLMSLAIKKNSRKYLLFGTCSEGLAKLYGSTKHSILIHKDRVKKKATFIFIAKRSICISGIGEIIMKKIKRLIFRKQNKNQTYENNPELQLVSDETVPSYFSERRKWQKIRL